MVEIKFADEVSKVWFNGRQVNVCRVENGSVAKVGVHAPNANQVLTFYWPQGRVKTAAKPCVWLHGQFRVLSQKPFVVGPGVATVKTAGPFVISASFEEAPVDLVAEGFPFMRSPVSLSTTLKLSSYACGLKLEYLSADAARVTIDGVDHGWVWGPDWELAVDLVAGEHVLKVMLVPNTYNYFGPHHYQRADWHVVSPDQFSGKCNFADPMGSPAKTLVEDWHFVPFRAPGVVVAIGS